MPWSPQDTQPTQKIEKPKYQPRHKKENNTGFKFLAVLAGLVLFLGLIAYVNWASLGSSKTPDSTPTKYVTGGPTATETETVPGINSTRTVTASPSVSPTATVTISPSATPTVTATATQTATATATATKTVPGPTKTVETPGPTKTVTKCYAVVQNQLTEIDCP